MSAVPSPDPGPLSRAAVDRQRKIMSRLAVAFFAAFALVLVVPIGARQVGMDVDAGQPYRWSDGGTVFVRVATGTYCQVAHGAGNPTTVDVPADTGGWLGLTGADVAGKGGSTNELTCERDAVVTAGAARFLTYPLRYSGWLALLCLGLCLTVIGYGLRTVYLRQRWGHGDRPLR